MRTRLQLLSVEADAKTSKGSKRGYLTGILYLAPAEKAATGYNLCPMSTAECRALCLYSAGMAGVYPKIKAARVRKTHDYIRDPKAFVELLRMDIRKLILLAQDRGMLPAVRINGTSDIPKLAMRLAREFSTVQFYDYTKIPRAWERQLDNYHLTFSYSGNNFNDCWVALHRGLNVSVVFNGALPSKWHGWSVINGDESDLRFLDPTGSIVGLKAKGLARRATTGGFIQIGG